MKYTSQAYVALKKTVNYDNIIIKEVLILIIKYAPCLTLHTILYSTDCKIII